MNKLIRILLALCMVLGALASITAVAVAVDVATADTAEASTNYSGLVNVRASMGWSGHMRIVIVEAWTDTGFTFQGGRLYGLSNTGNDSNLCYGTYCRTIVNVNYWQSCGGVQGFYSGAIREGYRNPVYYLSPKVNAC